MKIDIKIRLSKIQNLKQKIKKYNLGTSQDGHA